MLQTALKLSHGKAKIHKSIFTVQHIAHHRHRVGFPRRRVGIVTLLRFFA